MKIKMLDPKTLIPYEKNPRRVNQGAINSVAASIQEFDFRQPIVVDKNLVVCIGHTRLQAALKLGLKKVPVEVADNLDDKQIAALRLIDNRTNELTTWDDHLLLEEIAMIQEGSEIDMKIFGFAESEIENKSDAGLVEYDKKFMMIIDFKNEADQKKAFEKLTKGGYSCKLLVS